MGQKRLQHYAKPSEAVRQGGRQGKRGFPVPRVGFLVPGSPGKERGHAFASTESPGRDSCAAHEHLGHGTPSFRATTRTIVRVHMCIGPDPVSRFSGCTVSNALAKALTKDQHHRIKP